MSVYRLHKTIEVAGIPILGVSQAESGAVAIRFRPEATAQQRADAQAIVNAFDWSAAAEAAWREDRQPERKALRQGAAAAVADINTYLALPSPTNAQNLAQIRRLSQIVKQLIQRLAQVD